MRNGSSKAPRVALLGCGAVGSLYYAPAIQQLVRAGEAQFVTAFDPAADRAQRLAASFPGATVATDFAALRDDVADLAIVASPSGHHARQVIELLEAGWSVLCEKPLAPTLAEGQAMVDAAERNGRLLAAGMVRRFLPAAQWIAAAVRTGLLGELRSMEVAEGSAAFDWPVASSDYFSHSAGSGGVMLDVGIHLLDLLTWWFGEPVELHYCDDAMGGVDVNALLTARYADAFDATIRVSRDTNLANVLVLKGSRGCVRWRGNQGERVELELDGAPLFVEGAPLVLDGTLRPQGAETVAAYNFEQSFVAQLRNVLDAVRGGAELLVPAANALGALRVWERCRAQRRLIAMDWLDDVEKARALQLHGGPA